MEFLKSCKFLKKNYTFLEQRKKFLLGFKMGESVAPLELIVTYYSWRMIMNKTKISILKCLKFELTIFFRLLSNDQGTDGFFNNENQIERRQVLHIGCI